jgi:hypothetical protein
MQLKEKSMVPMALIVINAIGWVTLLRAATPVVDLNGTRQYTDI